MDNELYHWGIKGMKWGIRRYQNSDGTLTAAGKKRYNKEMDKLKKERDVIANREKTKKKMDRLQALKDSNDARKKALDGDPEEVATQKKKGGSDSNKDTPQQQQHDQQPRPRTDNDKLREQIERIKLERELASLQPKHVSKGKKFVSSLGNDVVAPAAKEAGKTLLTNFLKKKGSEMLGLDEKDLEDGMKKLKKEAEKAGYEQKIYGAKKAEYDYYDARDKYNKGKSKPSSDSKPDSKPSSDSKPDSKPSNDSKSDSKPSSTYGFGRRPYVDDIPKSTRDRGRDVVSSNLPVVYDWSNAVVDGSNVSRGRNIVGGLLGSPRDDK